MDTMQTRRFVVATLSPVPGEFSPFVDVPWGILSHFKVGTALMLTDLPWSSDHVLSGEELLWISRMRDLATTIVRDIVPEHIQTTIRLPSFHFYSGNELTWPRGAVEQQKDYPADKPPQSFTFQIDHRTGIEKLEGYSVEHDPGSSSFTIYLRIMWYCDFDSGDEDRDRNGGLSVNVVDTTRSANFKITCRVVTPDSIPTLSVAMSK